MAQQLGDTLAGIQIVSQGDGDDCEQPVYQEQPVPGKGDGCIALRDLKAGSLVLREVPALYVTPDLDGHAETIKAFIEMDQEDQDELLMLCNMYDLEEREWSESMRKELDLVVENAGEMDFSGTTRDTAMKVWQIWLTNAYDNGVFLKLSNRVFQFDTFKINFSRPPYLDFHTERIDRKKFRSLGQL